MRRRFHQQGGWRRPPRVEHDASGARLMRDDRVEDLAATLVRIKSLVEEVAQPAAGLRRSKRKRVLGGHSSVRRVFHPGRGISHGGESESRDRWILRDVRKLVSLARLEAAFERHGVARELPLCAWKGRPLGAECTTDSQRVFRRGRVTRRVADQVADRRCIPVVGDESCLHQTGNASRDREVDPNRAFAPRIELPSDLHDRVTAGEQKAVSNLPLGRVCCRSVKGVQRDSPASVHDVEQRDSIAPAYISRPEDDQVGRHLDLAGGVLRRLIQIGDDLIPLVAWIDQKIDPSAHAFVDAGGPKCATARNIATRGDLHARDLGARKRGNDDRQEDRQSDVSK